MIRLDLVRNLARGSSTFAICLLLGTGCGSVGSGLKVDAGTGGSSQGGSTGTGGASTGTGGTSTGAGGTSTGAGGATSGAGGAGGSVVDAAVDAPNPGTGGSTPPADAGADRAGSDAPIDAGPPPVSCQAIKQQNPAAASGVYTIAPLGTSPQSSFCEMTSGGGGWTAFYVGDNGTTPGGMHFETAANTCPDPPNSCLRRLPSTIDTTHEFAVKCGASVVKFNLDAMALDYFTNGLEHGWRPLTNAVTIDTGLVGKANLVVNVWTGGTVANYGWIIAGPDAPTSSAPAVLATTFGNGYTPNASWNFCNGLGEAAPGSRVMLFYR